MILKDGHEKMVSQDLIEKYAKSNHSDIGTKQFDDQLATFIQLLSNIERQTKEQIDKNYGDQDNFSEGFTIMSE